jgi:hypothetical protein
MAMFLPIMALFPMPPDGFWARHSPGNAASPIAAANIIASPVAKSFLKISIELYCLSFNNKLNQLQPAFGHCDAPLHSWICLRCIPALLEHS